MTKTVLIPYFESNIHKRDMLKKCIDSLKGDYDELIIINDIEPRGMTRAVVQGHAVAHGDFIITISDDAELVTGSLTELCDKDAVTAPLLNNDCTKTWGPVFCTPRWVYEKVGTWDIAFDGGLGYDDDEYRFRLKAKGIPDHFVHEVNFIHPWGGTTIKEVGDAGTRGMAVERNRKIYMDIINRGYK
jgi:hypothetical protein